MQGMSNVDRPLSGSCLSPSPAPAGDFTQRRAQRRAEEVAADRRSRQRLFVEGLPRKVLLMAARQELERAMAERDAIARQSRLRTARRLKARAQTRSR